jgi:glucose 1-dehydrogenase
MTTPHVQSHVQSHVQPQVQSQVQSRSARFVGGHALVTGGASGIGRAIARRLAQEGAAITFTHLPGDEAAAEALDELHAAGPAARHHAEAADVADRAAMEAVAARAIGRAGHLSLLVNNAGIQAEQPSDALDMDRFERIVAVDLLAVAHLCGLVIGHMAAQGGGAILNVSSVHEIVPKPGFLSYSVAKGGLGNLTRTLALEFAARGVRVNAVGPGATVTPMNAGWTGDPERRRIVEAHIPMGRPAEADEIAAVAAFLLSDEASYVTGQTLFACGGLSLFADFARNWST